MIAEAKRVTVRWMGKGKKCLMIPVPDIARCERNEEVWLDPTGDIPEEDAVRLMEINGPDGMFRIVGELSLKEEVKVASVPTVEPEVKATPVAPICQCGCGREIVIKSYHKQRGIPKFLAGHDFRKHAHATDTPKGAGRATTPKGEG